MFVWKPALSPRPAPLGQPLPTLLGSRSHGQLRLAQMPTWPEPPPQPRPMHTIWPGEPSTEAPWAQSSDSAQQGPAGRPRAWWVTLPQSSDPQCVISSTPHSSHAPGTAEPGKGPVEDLLPHLPHCRLPTPQPHHSPELLLPSPAVSPRPGLLCLPNSVSAPSSPPPSLGALILRAPLHAEVPFPPGPSQVASPRPGLLLLTLNWQLRPHQITGERQR